MTTTMTNQSQTQTAGPAAVVSTPAAPSLLESIIAQGRLARDDEQRAQAYDQIGTFVDQILAGEIRVSTDTQAMINARIAQIDVLLTRGLNAILHHKDYQKLEASWRGLNELVTRSETGTELKLRVLNVSKDDLRKDAERAAEPDQTALFKKVYEEEYGTFGGSPIGALVGDYEFSRTAQDITLLESIAKVAATAHAPFVAAASPHLFNWDDFGELQGPRELSKIFETDDCAKWRSFRASEDARYVALCLPHTLMRLPYDRENNPAADLSFVEDVNGTDSTKYLWGNAAYAFASRLTEAFARYHWCAAIRGVEGGGLVTGLPAHTFKTDDGDIALKCPTEIAVTDRRERELAKLGFIPLTHCKGTDYAAFFSAQSVQAERKYDKASANANARLATQLPYIFATSRIAHYLKAMMRDKIGNYVSRVDCERGLNAWISQYVTPVDDAQPEVKAQFPFREASIEVVDVPGKPGVYKAVAFLRPHFQLDELTISLRLVAELPQSAQR
jgi:type VI secretion system protein ImpC